MSVPNDDVTLSSSKGAPPTAPSEGARPNVAIVTRVPPVVVEHLRAHVDVHDVSSEPRAAWDAALADADGVIVSSGTPADAAFLAAAPRLRIVSTWSVGYDNVDVATLRERGIVLTNTKGSLVEAVADLAYALVIAAMRGIARGVNWVRDGRWAGGDMPHAHDLADATLGIVGFGEIGLAVSKRAHVSGMRVIYHNRNPRADDALTGAAYRPFDTLLSEADCVALLVPLTPETRGLIGARALAAMKPTAVLVNAARGAVVDTNALLSALDAGVIAGAALDVTDPEPLPRDHPLIGRDDVLIVPHIGSLTVETRTRMAMRAADNVIAFLEGREPPTRVSL